MLDGFGTVCKGLGRFAFTFITVCLCYKYIFLSVIFIRKVFCVRRSRQKKIDFCVPSE